MTKVRRYSRRSASRPNFIEPLESRQLLSLVVDLRLPGGGTEVSLTSKTQVVNVEVWATVTGSDSTGTNDGVQDVFASFISKNANGGAALGTLSATRLAPFDGTLSANGTKIDLDGDGDLDVGSNNNLSPDGYFLARSNNTTLTGGTLGAHSQSFHIGNLTFTTSQLLFGSGAYTQLRFAPRPPNVSPEINSAVWTEDGVIKKVGGRGSQGSFAVGTSVFLRRNIGTISGKVFNDKNSNGNRDSNESGLSNWRVFIDSNKNKIFDKGELSVLSTNGNYS